MNRKVVKWILGLLVLGLLITGAVIGYRKLSPRYSGDNGGLVSVDSTEKKKGSADTDETSGVGETVTVEGISATDNSGNSAEGGETFSPEGTSSEGESAAASEGESSSEEPETMIVPDFTMKDEEGNDVRLSDYFDKPAVLNFWASWCPPCRSEMPCFDTAYQEYGEKIHFILVDLTDGSRETEEDAKAFVAEQGFSFPIYFDTTLEGAYSYGVNSIPMTLFLDPDGVLRAYRIGALTEDMLFGELLVLFLTF